MKIEKLIFSLLLFLAFNLFMNGCSEKKDNPVSPSSGPPGETPVPPPTPTWSTLFSADFNGADGPLLGDWSSATIANYHNIARGNGPLGNGQMAICNLNVSNIAYIKITAQFSNLVNGNYVGNLLARASGSDNGYVGWVDFNNLTIATLSAAGPGNIATSTIAISNSKWYILEFELKLSGANNITLRLKDRNTSSIIQTISASHYGINSKLCGFTLEAPSIVAVDYVYSDNFKIEKFE